MALVYTRVSSDEQAIRGLSLDAQMSECRRYALRQSWTLGAEFTDVLAGWRDDRPQYQQLLRDVRQWRSQGTGVVVVVAALDRLGRRLLERVRSRDELKALGVPIHSVREGGEVSDLVANILASVAQEETRRQGERIKATWSEVRARGWQVNGQTRWGYQWRPATEDERRDGAPQRVLDVDELAAPYVRELFRRVAEGESIRAAARWVASLPEPVRQGKRLGYASVQRALTSPTYLARASETSGDALAGPLQRWPALIDVELWQRVQRSLQDHQHHAHQASGRYLLSGYLRCPRCGSGVVGTRVKGRYGAYRCGVSLGRPGQPCRWSISIPQAEGPVLAAVEQAIAALDGPEFRERLRRAWLERSRGDDPSRARDTQVAQLRRDLVREEQRLTDAALRLLDGVLDRAAYDRVVARGQQIIPQLEGELARIETAPVLMPLRPFAEVLAAVQAWPQASIGGRRRILAILVERVRVEGQPYRQRPIIEWTPVGQLLQRAVNRSGRE